MHTMSITSRITALRALVVAAAASVIIGLAIAPTAGATSLTSYPTFECYSSGIIRADELGRQVNLDGRTTVWAVHLSIWNARQRRWVDYWNSKFNRFQDTSFGVLVDSPIDVRVARGHYYEATDVVESTGDARPQTVLDEAIMGRTATGAYRPTQHICYVP
jgi:hypothetical protein